jgi:voltage-gated potassium channel
MELIIQLAVASAMVAATIVMHLAGLGGLIALMRNHQTHFATRRARLDQVVILLGVAFGLFALHAVEIWTYAGLYHALTGWPRFEEALYFSTSTYATLGYGDVTLPRQWRVLGAIEGANGVILLGWSTAFFVSVVARLRALEHDWGVD